MSVLLLLLPLACTPEPTAPAPRFAEASQAQLDATFASAFGYGSFGAFLATYQAEIDAMAQGADAPCPTLTLEGATMTLGADGCTGPESGTTWAGAVTTTNAPGLSDLLGGGDAGDPDAPYRFELAAWTGETPAGTTTFDGSFGMSDWGLGATWESDQDLRAELPGLAAFSTTAHMRCVRLDDGSSTCTPDEAQTGWVDGIGDLRVSGDGVGIGAEGHFTGLLEVAGPADTLSIDLGQLGAACVDATLDDGATVELCLPGPVQDDGAAPAGGYGEGPLMGLVGPWIDGEGLGVAATTAAPVAEVELSLDGELLGLGEETHPLGGGAWNEAWELYAYELAIPGGEYVPGASTAFPETTDLGQVAIALRAYDDTGAVSGCLFVLPRDAEGLEIGTEEDWFDTAACPTR